MNLQSRSKIAPVLPIVSALFAGAVIGLAGKSLLDSRKRRRPSRGPVTAMAPVPPVAALVPPVTAAPIDPEQLIRDVRESFNGVVTDPQAIDVSCAEGRILLKGSVFRDEVQPLLDSVQAVPGVNGVENQLTEIDPMGSFEMTGLPDTPNSTESSGAVDLTEASDISEFMESDSASFTNTVDETSPTESIHPDKEAHFSVESSSLGSIVPPVVTEAPPPVELSPDEELDQQNRA